MPRKQTPPTYLKRTEKGKDYAYCYLFGAQKRLGSYGTKDSFRRFERCLAAYEQKSTDSLDGCPLDPEKSAPGICGCGVSDIDSDGDGIADCEDCIADVTNDGEVGGQDLAFVLAAWGDANLFPLADINQDGLVNGTDITYILANWGVCPPPRVTDISEPPDTSSVTSIFFAIPGPHPPNPRTHP